MNIPEQAPTVANKVRATGENTEAVSPPSRREPEQRDKMERLGRTIGAPDNGMEGGSTNNDANPSPTRKPSSIPRAARGKWVVPASPRSPKKVNTNKTGVKSAPGMHETEKGSSSSTSKTSANQFKGQSCRENWAIPPSPRDAPPSPRDSPESARTPSLRDQVVDYKQAAVANKRHHIPDDDESLDPFGIGDLACANGTREDATIEPRRNMGTTAPTASTDHFSAPLSDVNHFSAPSSDVNNEQGVDGQKPPALPRRPSHELLALFLESIGDDANASAEVALNDTTLDTRFDWKQLFGSQGSFALSHVEDTVGFEFETENSGMDMAAYYDLSETKKARMMTTKANDDDDASYPTFATLEGDVESAVPFSSNGGSPPSSGEPHSSSAVPAETSTSDEEGAPEGEATSSTPPRNGPTIVINRRPPRFRMYRATRPGAVSIRGRAFGQRPSWARTQVRDSPRTQVASDEEALGVIEATAVMDEDNPMPLVYAEVQSTNKNRSALVCMGLGVMLLVLTAIGFLIAGVAFSAFDGSEDGSTDDLPTLSPTPPPTNMPTVALDEILDALMEFSSAEDLQDKGSPQNEAMFWLANLDATGIEFTDPIFLQRYALVVLHFATSKDDGWLKMDDWLNPTKHECDWGPQIVCKEDDLGHRDMRMLDLSRNGLNGILPSEVGFLTTLETLHLNENSLKGLIPDALGELTNLRSLEMEKNEFGGLIPSTIGQLSDLTTISLAHNRLSGTIPQSFYRLNSVREVNLSFNLLEGKLEDGLKNMTVLLKLNLISNRISGTIPDTFNFMPELAFLYLDHNRLNGTIPAFSGFMARRQELTVSNNRLTGPIPATLPPGGLETTEEGFPTDAFRLQKADASNNLLTGEIPIILAYVSSLRYLNLANNSMTGAIPDMGASKSLGHLSLADNYFTGPIPKVLPRKIKHLDVKGNLLEGGIPREISNARSLQILSVGDNNLFGSIPEEIGSLMKDLKAFSSRNSGLTGTIPTTLGNLAELNVLDLGDNKLNGTLPIEFGELTMLYALTLESNELWGALPSSLGLLVDLRVLDVSDNSFSGPIPTLSNLDDLEELYLDGNGFEGSVPEDVCALHEESLLALQVDCDVKCNCCDNIFRNC